MHWIRRAASRADCTAGSSREIRTAMIAMTTRSSISVKPPRRSRPCSIFIFIRLACGVEILGALSSNIAGWYAQAM